MSKTPLPLPAQEHLHYAYNRLWKQGWDDFDSTMAHPIRGKIIIMAARTRERTSGVAVEVGQPAPKKLPLALPLPPLKGVIDFKKRAAGDIEKGAD